MVISTQFLLKGAGGRECVDWPETADRPLEGSSRHCCQAASLVAYILPIARANRITTRMAPSASVQVALESAGVQELSRVRASTNKQALVPSRTLPHKSGRRTTRGGLARSKTAKRSTKRKSVASTKNRVMLASVRL